MNKLINWTFELRQLVGRVRFVRARQTEGGRYIEEIDKLPPAVKEFLMLKPNTRVLDAIRNASTLEGFKFTTGTYGILKADVEFPELQRQLCTVRSTSTPTADLGDQACQQVRSHAAIMLAALKEIVWQTNRHDEANEIAQTAIDKITKTT